MKIAFVKILLFLLVFFLLPCSSIAQNIVLSVTGKVLVDGQLIKKGDNLKDNLKVVFGDANAELKVLSPVGVCIIKYKNYQQKSSSELLDLVKLCIRKNSVATLGTRAWKVNPSKEKQIELVGALCKTLNIVSDNVNYMFDRYITPYCILEFDTPYWQDIANFMQTTYGFNQPRFTGELMAPDKYQQIPLVPKSRSLAQLPSMASVKQYAPIPGNQGKYNTCTAWASAYAARTISWAVRNNLTDIQDITNQAFSPSFVYEQIKSDNDAGASIDASVDLLKSKGVAFMTDVPYQCQPYIDPFMQQAKTYAIKDYQRLTANVGMQSKEDLDNMKRSIADKKPVLVGIKCYQSFDGKVWNGILNNLQGNHAMCMVGYDDNYNNGDGTYGAVELMNSWGTTWGDGGFIRVKYQDIPKILNYAISLYDDALAIPPPEPVKPLPTPPLAPDAMKRMEGTFSLVLRDGTTMQLEGSEASFRGLRLASAEQMTYNILHPYPAGTMFRINFTSSQPAYVYIISTDAKRSPLAQLFPDPEKNISPLLDFKSEVSVSIPDETQYIQMDDTAGEDYLCIIYSKEALDITSINSAFQSHLSASFVQTVKIALANQIVEDNEVTFEKKQIAFKAASATHTVIPIFIKIQHR